MLSRPGQRGHEIYCEKLRHVRVEAAPTTDANSLAHGEKGDASEWGNRKMVKEGQGALGGKLAIGLLRLS